jgi:hypothetical protein
MTQPDPLKPSLWAAAFRLLTGERQYVALAISQDIGTNLKKQDLAAYHAAGKWPTSEDYADWEKRHPEARKHLRAQLFWSGVIAAAVLAIAMLIAAAAGMPDLSAGKRWGVPGAWLALWAGLMPLCDANASWNGERLDERLRRAALGTLVCGAALCGFVAALLP